MSRRRFIALLVAAAIAISAALYLSAQRNLPRESHGGALLPTLAGKLDAVTAVSVRRGSAAPVTLHQVDGRWTVAERDDYPADVPKLRKLLLALSDAKIVEEKTSNPANFAAIGVEDPTLPGASGAQVTVTARDANLTVIVGKTVGAGNFARRGGENTSYSVEPGISFETEPRFWIEPRLLDLTAAAIQSIQVKPADGPGYTVRREPASGGAPPGATPPGGVPPSGVPPSGTFTLEGTPPNRKAADSAALAPSPTAFTGLSADDVSKLEDIDFSKATVATVTMSDGNIILTGAVKGDKHWIRLQASKDAALNAKTAGRAFEIASYRFDAIFRPLEQLLVPKAPPPAAKPAPAKSPPAKSPPTKKPVPAPTP